MKTKTSYRIIDYIIFLCVVVGFSNTKRIKLHVGYIALALLNKVVVRFIVMLNSVIDVAHANEQQTHEQKLKKNATKSESTHAQSTARK